MFSENGNPADSYRCFTQDEIDAFLLRNCDMEEELKNDDMKEECKNCGHANSHMCDYCGVNMFSFRGQEILSQKEINALLVNYDNTVNDAFNTSNKKEEINEAHYGGNIQPIEFMQANFNKEEFIGFLKGNAIKYISCAGKKRNNSYVDDIKKAQRYLDWLLYALRDKVINPRE